MTTSKAASSVDAIAGHSRSTGGGFLFKRSTLVPLLLGLFLCSSAADAQKVKATTTTTTTTTPALFCGDGRCSVGIGETCTTCREDCGDCTNPNCPDGTSTCKCLDGSTSCRFDQDCPAIVTTTIIPGVCDSGSRSGLSCQTNADCPNGNRFGTCTTKTVTTSTPALTGTCIDKSPANCCNLWCSQSYILGGLVIDGSGFMNTPHCNCGGSYCATCAATPLVQSHYTGMSGTVCDDPHNIYEPCESDNGGTVVASFKDTTGDVIAWNECNLGTFTASGVIDAGGFCRCMGTVTDGDGDGVPSPFTKELWNSGCADCNDDLSFCLPYAKFCNVV